MSHPLEPGFERHVFVCTNQRPEGHVRGCCEAAGGGDLLMKLKRVMKERGLAGPCRVNKAGCLDHCEQGAVVVVYPEAVWYGGVGLADVEEIVEEHLVHGRPVERLRMRVRSPPRDES